MIILDTETTGLIIDKPFTPLNIQPHITELAMIKTDNKGKRIASFESFFKIPIPVPPEIVTATGITDEMLKDQEPFRAALREVQDFFIGEEILIAHNVDFDAGMIALELQRCGAERKFPWPPTHICTCEFSRAYHQEGRRMTLSVLHDYLFGKEFEGAHRAMVDTEALHRCVFEMIKRKDLVI